MYVYNILFQQINENSSTDRDIWHLLKFQKRIAICTKNTLLTVTLKSI